jgi:3-methyladenine DNA glycosylase AlkD
MDFILDNKETEKEFQQILKIIKSKKNGEVSDLMNAKGINYKINWGTSITELREISKLFMADHVLALKLWNKGWRETMILSTLLDEPELVTEEQMDFHTKSFENIEIAEQSSTNLYVKTKFAFVKALEWCRGKKHFVRFTGVHLIGRLALTEKNAIDEMFEPFFEELETLAKDSKLHSVIHRCVIALGTRSLTLNKQSIELAQTIQLNDSETAAKLGEDLFTELTGDEVQEILKLKTRN